MPAALEYWKNELVYVTLGDAVELQGAREFDGKISYLEEPELGGLCCRVY